MSTMPIPPCVLCPGLDGTGNNFWPFQRLLDEHTVPNDAVVYGRMDSHGPIARADYVRQVQVVRDQPSSFVSGTPHLVVAESFSGPIAIQAVHDRPCAGLVLVATFCERPRRWPRWLLHAAGPFLGRLVPPQWALRASLAGATSEEVLDRLQESMLGLDPMVADERLRLVADTHVSTQLAAFDAPVLVISGRRDRLLSRGDVERLREARPDARFVELDGPHLLLQTRPGEVFATIQEWWSRL